jgi:hypothetical protein
MWMSAVVESTCLRCSAPPHEEQWLPARGHLLGDAHRKVVRLRDLLDRGRREHWTGVEGSGRFALTAHRRRSRVGAGRERGCQVHTHNCSRPEQTTPLLGRLARGGAYGASLLGATLRKRERFAPPPPPRALHRVLEGCARARRVRALAARGRVPRGGDAARSPGAADAPAPAAPDALPAAPRDERRGASRPDWTSAMTRTRCFCKPESLFIRTLFKRCPSIYCEKE